MRQSLGTCLGWVVVGMVKALILLTYEGNGMVPHWLWQVFAV
jgi:hypothetical protein